MNQPETDTLNSIVARVMRIEDITTGAAGQDFLVRYRGELLIEPTSAYDRLAANLRQLNITPLFRQEGGIHIILLVAGTITRSPGSFMRVCRRRTWLAAFAIESNTRSR